MESTSLRKFGGSLGSQSKVCDLHHSTISGRILIQNEFIHYDAQSEREFFVDLPTNLNHLNYAKFRLTGSHGRNLHFFSNSPRNWFLQRKFKDKTSIVRLPR
jgi:hypothetical protein